MCSQKGMAVCRKRSKRSRGPHQRSVIDPFCDEKAGRRCRKRAARLAGLSPVLLTMTGAHSGSCSNLWYLSSQSWLHTTFRPSAQNGCCQEISERLEAVLPRNIPSSVRCAYKVDLCINQHGQITKQIVSRTALGPSEEHILYVLAIWSDTYLLTTPPMTVDKKELQQWYVCHSDRHCGPS